jgi:UDP-2,4-diacetamido-2,4,6-trideoxy-beta-L-altropyranose hydrolase
LIRADASPQIGTGHVMRCLALAQAWQERGGNVVLAAATISPGLAERLRAEAVELHTIEAMPGDAADAQLTLALAQELQAQWVVLDNYHFDDGYQQALKQQGLHLLAVDDYGHASHQHADIVLNQNIYASAALYPQRKPTTRLLLGCDYALLRREFWPWRRWQRPIAANARRVLVTLGGADPHNTTARVVQALAQIDKVRLELVVLVGASNPFADAIEAAAVASHHQITLRRNVNDMPELMAWADVAITAAGSTCWELLAMGLPAIIMALADNQLPIGDELARRELVVYLGWHNDWNAQQLATALADLLRAQEQRSDIAQRSRTLVGGGGAGRVVTEMLSDMLVLRPATSDDSRRIWHWANDAATRAMSFSSAAIPWESHERWYSARLADANCRFFIAAYGEEALGQVRYDLDGDDAIVSIGLAPEQRGRGWGPRILRTSATQLFAQTPVRRIIAYIKPENIASQRAFERAGYRLVRQETVRGKRALRYECSKGEYLADNTDQQSSDRPGPADVHHR